MPDEETIKDVVDSMTDKQRTVLYALVGMAANGEGADMEHSDDEGEKGMKRNVFYGADNQELDSIKQSDIDAIFSDIKGGAPSLKKAALQHGIENIDYLFPEARNVTDTPTMITREMSWVQKVLGAVHKTPFSRIKSMAADLREDEARAKGYMKGNLKKEQVFALLKRTTTPQTIYKKQKLDRDDVIDIIDFDVVAWIKVEMRFMLDEEIARALLVGDGRLIDAEDKISEEHIRPIWTDADLYTIKALLEVTAKTDADTRARQFIRAVVKSRKEYQGSGNPTLYASEDIITDCLLIEDTTGRIIYDSITKLATALRVSEIISVPIMENLNRTVGVDTHYLMGIIVNLTDYNIGADRGGAVNLFDDFDIDFNQQKYLIETRCSGALIKPYSAITVEYKIVPASGV